MSIKKKKKIIIALFVIELLLAVFFIGYKYALSEYRTMKQYGNDLKTEAKQAYNEIKQFNFVGAEEKMNEIKTTSDRIREKLKEPLWRIAGIITFAKDKIEAVRTTLDVLDEGIETIGEPRFKLVKEYPFDQFKVGEGFNAGIIRAYIDFAEKAEPKAQELLSRVLEVDLSFVDTEGKIEKYKEKADVIFELFKNIKDDLDVAKTIIGTEDRYYIFAAQNSSEIRAAGGFVGSVGTIVIKDGILYIGDFKTVYKVMEQDTPSSGNVTDKENELFNRKLLIAHDSEYDPDFRRVAEIWASAYEPYNNVAVDGVISMTPVLVQRMLSLTGSEITLSDGTVVNGENATKVIEYDIYHKYFNIYSWNQYSNEYTDSLFAETAKKAMKEFTSHFNVKQLLDYYKMYKESVQDRTLMIWMKDTGEEQIMINAGVSGVLNIGENNAVAGVYFSNCSGSKMGIFTNIDCHAEKTAYNEDGTTEYKVTVILKNSITDSELDYDSIYILGKYNGTIAAYVHLFAPVGGTISNIQSSDGLKYIIDEYLGMQVGYSLDVFVYPRKPITITYTVTTAAGVNNPLEFSVTPTLQKYVK